MAEAREMIESVDGFIAPDHREARMHVATALPDPELHSEVDDSVGIVYIHGFGETMEVCRINAQALADLTGNPVTSYDHATGRHVGESFRTGLPQLYMHGFLKAIEVHTERFPETERIEGIGFSLGGMALAYAAEQEAVPHAAVFVKAVGTDGPAELSTHGADQTLREQLYHDLSRPDIAAHGRRLRGAFLGMEQMRMSAPHLLSDPQLATATMRGVLSQGFNLMARYPHKHLWAFGIAETLDAQHMVARRRDEIAFGVVTGKTDPLFSADKAVEHMAGDQGVHKLSVVETGHVPLASSKHHDLHVVRDMLVDLRGVPLTNPTEIVEDEPAAA